MNRLVGRSRASRLPVASLETSPGSGVFEVDERLSVMDVTLDSDEAVSTARLAVRLDEQFDAALAKARYAPDLRVIVSVHDGAMAEPVVLFEGHPPVQEAQWRGGPGRADDSFGFVATHVYDRLSRDRRCWIYGRRMRNGVIEDGLSVDPASWADRSLLVEALPCVFNFDGQPNRAAEPMTVVAPDGSPRSVHLFTHDNDSAGVAWTYLTALRYLVWFYAPREGPVFEGNVFSATDAFVAEAMPEASTELVRRLLKTPASLNCEATNLVEALALLAEAAGIHITVDTVAIGAGVQSRFRAWAPGDGPRKSPGLARGGKYPDGVRRFDASSLRAADVFRANQVSAADIRWDDRRIVNAPIVIGDVKGYEMTVPLVPGWAPVVNLDNVAPADRDDAKALALTPEQVATLGPLAELSAWYRMYHRNGSQFAAHRWVGRRWVLNEDGRFDGAAFNRNAPFDDYQPFDFATVTNDDITTRGQWVRRSRPLLPTITRTELGAGFGVLVEISFDSGATWHPPVGAVSILTDPTAIAFEAANPTQITPPGVDPLEQNLWYAIIDQTFRVRVTAVIEGDARVIAKPNPDESATPTLQTNATVVYRPTVYRYATRRGTTNVLADVNPDGEGIERDDSTVAEADAATLAGREQGRRVSATPVVPWFDTAFDVGDEIIGIRGRSLSLASRADGQNLGLVVVSKRWRFGAGKWETALVLE